MLVGLGEGLALGVVYLIAGVPHPTVFGALTALAAMIPGGALVLIALAALVKLATGSALAAGAVFAIGGIITFAADHFIRPVLIGGATRLPFIWVLLGILGGGGGVGTDRAVPGPGDHGSTDPAVAGMDPRAGGGGGSAGRAAGAGRPGALPLNPARDRGPGPGWLESPLPGRLQQMGGQGVP